MDEHPSGGRESPGRRPGGHSSGDSGFSGKGTSWKASLREAGPYLGMGAQIAGTMALFVGGGYLADRWLGSSPWGLIVGGGVGMAAAFFYIARVSRELGEASASSGDSSGERGVPGERGE